MKIPYRQPWFQILVAIVIVIIAFIICYYVGKRDGRSEKENAFDQRQNELLIEAQKATARADFYQSQAQASEDYANRLAGELVSDRHQATTGQQKAESEFVARQQENIQKYETDKALIASDLSTCDRCRDLCERANKLSQYGPEFAKTKCDTHSCEDACK